MQDTQLNRISNFLWSVSDDLLRDLYVRGKYRDVILPMTVLRRLDAVLEPTKQKVLKEKQFLDDNGITEQDGVLQQEAGHAFYNTSQFTMRDLAARAAQQSLRADFEAYLDGYSANVQEILDNFEFRNQINRLSQSDVLGALIARFLSPDINLSPYPVKNDDGSVKLPGLDNHAMGTIFEDLVRRFNEENNEEAGEHWTPREAVELMAQLVFQPVAEQIQSGTYLLYDGAIAQAHKAAGHPSPVAEKDMRLTIAGIARTDYRSQAQAAPLDVAALKPLLPLPSVPGWEMWCDGKRRLRRQAGALDIALVLLVSDAGLRRSEAADLTRGDAVRRPDGTGRITMCRSKTDATYDELGAWVPLRYSGELRRLPLIAGVEDDYSGHSGRVRMATRMGPTAPPPATSYAKDGGVPSPSLPAPLRAYPKN